MNQYGKPQETRSLEPSWLQPVFVEQTLPRGHHLEAPTNVVFNKTDPGGTHIHIHTHSGLNQFLETRCMPACSWCAHGLKRFHEKSTGFANGCMVTPNMFGMVHDCVHMTLHNNKHFTLSQLHSYCACCVAVQLILTTHQKRK